MGADDQTPVRRVSTAALDLGAVAAEDLLEHLRRAGFIIEAAPPGFVSRVASWMARAGRRVAQVEIKTTETMRAELDLVIRQRDVAIATIGDLREELKATQRERDRLTTLMRPESDK